MLIIDLDLIFVGLAIISIFILGFVVLLNNLRSSTNVSFFWLALTTGAWSVCNYFVYQTPDSSFALNMLRLATFFAVFNAFFIFQVFFFFPEEKRKIPLWHKTILWPFASLSSLLTLTPYVFNRVVSVTANGRIDQVANGPGIAVFSIAVLGFIFGGFFNFYRKLYIKKSIDRTKFKFMFIGTLVTFSFILLFNFIFPAILNISDLGRFGAVYTFPFIVFTAYSVIRYQIFNVKVITTELIVFALWIFLLIRTLISNNINDIVINAALFIITLIVGIFLIRSVRREVDQKDYLAVLNKELQGLIKQRENLVHLITHKVKGSFTRSKYIFAEMVAGSFGDLNEQLGKMAQKGLDSDNEGLKTVDLVLNAFNLQSGTVKYEMKPMNLKEAVLASMADKEERAKAKGLNVELHAPDEEYKINGDRFWLKEVVNNFLENSIRYSLKGNVDIFLEKKPPANKDEEAKILLSVKDEGVGITEEDKKNLFTEGGRGKDSLKMNVDSTGYGLFSVKVIVEQHGGRVWAESEGRNKGSQFYVELPAFKEVSKKK